eukprot:403363355
MATFDDLVDVINPVDKKQGIYDKNKDLIKMIYKTKDQYFFIIDLYNENTTHIYPGPNISFNEQNFTITLRAATYIASVDKISSLCWMCYFYCYYLGDTLFLHYKHKLQDMDWMVFNIF